MSGSMIASSACQFVMTHERVAGGVWQTSITRPDWRVIFQWLPMGSCAGSVDVLHCAGWVWGLHQS